MLADDGVENGQHVRALAGEQLDRAVTHLLRSGWFDRVRGVVLGEFTDCGAPGAVRALLRERLGGLGVPVVWGAPVGHGTRNLAFPLGVPATPTPTPGR